MTYEERIADISAKIACGIIKCDIKYVQQFNLCDGKYYGQLLSSNSRSPVTSFLFIKMILPQAMGIYYGLAVQGALIHSSLTQVVLCNDVVMDSMDFIRKGMSL